MTPVREIVRAVRAVLHAAWQNRRRLWTIARLPIGLALLLGLALPLPTHSDTVACPLQARLSVGSVARVAFALAIDPSGPRPMRDYPAADAPIVSPVAPGAALRVLQGPTCADGVRWWQVTPLVDKPAMPIGWMAETDADRGYALEPWQVLLDYAQPTINGAAVLRVNAQGVARWLIADPIDPIDAQGLRQYPGAESGPLVVAMAAALVNCPKRARWVDPTPDQALSIYASPDSTRLLAVRHLWRSVQGCDGSITARYGVDRLSLIAPNGERILFDIPLHANPGSLPAIADAPIPVDQVNQITSVVWSPDNIHAVAAIRYRSATTSPLTRLIVIDVVNGTIHDLDSGFAPHWSADGSRLSWLRMDGATLNLIDATPANIDRQTRALPADSNLFAAPIAPQWTADGTRLMRCTQPEAEAALCAWVNIVDMAAHRMLTPVPVPADVSGIRWIENDRALWWLPDDHNGQPTRVRIQPIADSPSAAEPPVQTFDLPTPAPGDRIVDGAGFPDGTHVLIVVRSVTLGLQYWVLDSETGAFQRVRFTV